MEETMPVNERKMSEGHINMVKFELMSKTPFQQQFTMDIFKKTNEFLNKYNLLINLLKEMYPGLNNSKESLLFGQICGFIIYCFEKYFNNNENMADMDNVIIGYWEKSLYDNLYQKTRIQEDFGSGYNLLRASSLQPILLDYVLSANLGNIDHEIPNINNRIDFILTLHTFINVLNKYYFYIKE